MTQEEKQLLLQDLCARLLYGVVYHRNDGANIKLNAIDVERGLLNYTDDIDERECKPYLRPMSSMTEEERDWYKALLNGNIGESTIKSIDRVINWLIANHFDFRGLIPMGLALPATKDMYN